MKIRPPIMVSSLDLERLVRLLSSASSAHLPGVAGLLSELDRATVVEPTKIPPNVVTMNSRVRFVEESSGTQYEMTIVYPEDSETPGTVSILAPFGNALLGLSVGQAITWRVPEKETLVLRVLEVVWQPEADGIFHL